MNINERNAVDFPGHYCSSAFSKLSNGQVNLPAVQETANSAPINQMQPPSYVTNSTENSINNAQGMNKTSYETNLQQNGTKFHEIFHQYCLENFESMLPISDEIYQIFKDINNHINHYPKNIPKITIVKNDPKPTLLVDFDCISKTGINFDDIKKDTSLNMGIQTKMDQNKRFVNYLRPFIPEFVHMVSMNYEVIFVADYKKYARFGEQIFNSLANYTSQNIQFCHIDVDPSPSEMESDNDVIRVEHLIERDPKRTILMSCNIIKFSHVMENLLFIKPHNQEVDETDASEMLDILPKLAKISKKENIIEILAKDCKFIGLIKSINNSSKSQPNVKYVESNYQETEKNSQYNSSMLKTSDTSNSETYEEPVINQNRFDFAQNEHPHSNEFTSQDKDGYNVDNRPIKIEAADTMPQITSYCNEICANNEKNILDPSDDPTNQLRSANDKKDVNLYNDKYEKVGTNVNPTLILPKTEHPDSQGIPNFNYELNSETLGRNVSYPNNILYDDETVRMNQRRNSTFTFKSECGYQMPNYMQNPYGSNLNGNFSQKYINQAPNPNERMRSQMGNEAMAYPNEYFHMRNAPHPQQFRKYYVNNYEIESGLAPHNWRGVAKVPVGQWAYNVSPRISQLIPQPVNQTFPQPVNQTVPQPVNQTFPQPVNQTFPLPGNQPTVQSGSQSIPQSYPQPVLSPRIQPVPQAGLQTVPQAVYRSYRPTISSNLAPNTEQPHTTLRSRTRSLESIAESQMQFQNVNNTNLQRSLTNVNSRIGTTIDSNYAKSRNENELSNNNCHPETSFQKNQILKSQGFNFHNHSNKFSERQTSVGENQGYKLFNEAAVKSDPYYYHRSSSNKLKLNSMPYTKQRQMVNEFESNYPPRTHSDSDYQ